MTRDNHQSMPPALWEAASASPAQRRRIERIWVLAGRAAQPLPVVPDTDAAWAGLQARLDTAPAHASERPPVARTRWFRRWGVGVIGLVLLLAAAWWRQPVTVAVPPGGHATVTLPDGSTVELNSASHLRYVRGFAAWPLVPADARLVRLEGEAFFDVVPDADRPFIVETFNARVEVLGTRFNVRARAGRDAEATEVALVSGRVRVVRREAARQPMVLAEAGEVARVGPRPAPVRVTPLEQVLAWRQQGFTAIDEPVGAILAEVERRFALTIETDVGIALADSMTLFYLHDATAEKILHDLCLSQRCHYRKTSRGYVLYEKG